VGDELALGKRLEAGWHRWGDCRRLQLRVPYSMNESAPTPAKMIVTLCGGQQVLRDLTAIAALGNKLAIS